MALMLQGALTALVTPFRDGAVDSNALEALVEHQIAAGIHGLVPCGTTGESPTLSAAEAQEVIARTVSVAHGRVPVLAGTGTNATAETIARTRAAQAAGVDGAMLVVPYYNKPSPRGIVAHVRAVHDATDIPLVIYNIPGRGSADMGVDTLTEIVRHCPRVVGLKEATGNILRAQSVVAALGDRVKVLCGDDALTVGMMACGATGVISVASNVVPAEVAEVCNAMLRGDFTAARRRQLSLLELYEALFLESNPGPVKAGLAWLGRIAPEVRLPLAWVTEATALRVQSALRGLGARVEAR